MRHPNLKQGVYLLPNLCTTANLFCGFFSVVRSLNGQFSQAAWAILLAGLFDFLDGQLARLTKTQSRFGLEYDSLVDSASFGFAPSLMIYTWSLYHLQRLGWVAAFLFFACGVLRLARFNIQIGSVERKDFQGLPIPAAACAIVGWVLLNTHFSTGIAAVPSISLLLTVASGMLMVSTLRYRSLKGFDFRSQRSFYFLVAIVGVLILIALEPNLFIFIGAATYMLSGVAEKLFSQWRQSNDSSRHPLKIVSAVNEKGLSSWDRS